MSFKEKKSKGRYLTDTFEIIEIVDDKGRLVGRKVEKWKREPELKAYVYSGGRVIYYKAKPA